MFNVADNNKQLTLLWFLKLYHWTKALIKSLFYCLSTQNLFNVADNNKQLTLVWFLIGLLHKVKVKIRTKSAVCCCLQYWASFELIINKISFITKKRFVKVFDHRISKIITKSAVCCCLQYCNIVMNYLCCWLSSILIIN